MEDINLKEKSQLLYIPRKSGAYYLYITSDSQTGTIPTPYPLQGNTGSMETCFWGHTRGAAPVFFFREKPHNATKPLKWMVF